VIIIKTNADNKCFWQKTAKFYTYAMHSNKHIYKKIGMLLNQYLNKNITVLELACGTGLITEQSAGSAKHWTATDYSENMLTEAKKHLHSFNNISFSVQDATRLTYNSEEFDVVVIANALHIMPEPNKALAEIHRVLKPNGILFAPTFVYEKRYYKTDIFIMKLLGFKTYHEWTTNEYGKYINSNSFRVQKTKLLKASPLPECVLVAKKR